MRELGLILSGAYIVYCWGVVAFYINSWSIFDPVRTKFADRVLYALRWPLGPGAAPLVMLSMILGSFGTAKQRAEAAQRLSEYLEKTRGKTFTPGNFGGGYDQ